LTADWLFPLTTVIWEAAAATTVMVTLEEVRPVLAAVTVNVVAEVETNVEVTTPFVGGATAPNVTLVVGLALKVTAFIAEVTVLLN